MLLIVREALDHRQPCAKGGMVANSPACANRPEVSNLGTVALEFRMKSHKAQRIMVFSGSIRSR